MDAINTTNPLLLIISLVFGSLIGQWINIELRLERLGNSLQKKFKNDSGFSKGFVTTSLIYCVGAMAILGSLQSGLTGDHTKLYVKASLDGITAIIFASTLGIGVLFSSVPVFIYQGLITLTASFVKDLLVDIVIIEMAAVGGILIIGIGINILEIKKIKVANMLPSVFIPIIYYSLIIPVINYITSLF